MAEMHVTARHLHDAGSILLPAALLALLTSTLVVETGLAPRPDVTGAEAVSPPATVVLAPRAFDFRPSGEFDRAGTAVAPALERLRRDRPLEIMTHEVTATDYARCVGAGGCKPAHPRHHGTGDVPATGVSFNDAVSYADWLSAQTGETWRLPSVEEWDFAAAGMAVGHGTEGLDGAADPARPWLAALDAAEEPTISPALRPVGGFGYNALGIGDLGGNVWEWTSDCNSRTRLRPDGGTITRIESCGVRILEGSHRMPLSAFVQDARGGGCSTGTPPDNLGFRLVREPAWYDGLPIAIRRVLRRL
jgi:formylglycine-generating enzyme required for sulfatase activity